MSAYLILFIKVLKSLRQLFGAKNVALFLPDFLLFIYIFRKWSYILFIKGLKSFRQLFGSKNIVALFLPNFLRFIYIFRKWSCILFIKGLKSLRQLFGDKNVVALFLPNILLFIYIFRKWSCILFIKSLKSLRQFFGAEKVDPHFLPNFLLFLYIFRKWSRILFLKVLKSLRRLFEGIMLLKSKLLRMFYYLSIGSIINEFFITRIGLRVNPNSLSFYISFGCNYKLHRIASTKIYGFCTWFTLNWRFEEGMECDVGDMETSFRSVRISFV